VRSRPVLVAALLLAVLGASCTPAPPPAPRPSIRLTTSLGSWPLPASSYELWWELRNFPAGAEDVTWVVRDNRTGAEVTGGTPQANGAVWLSALSIETSGGRHSIDVTTTVTARVGGVSATASKVDRLDWPVPSSPFAGTMTAAPGAYQQQVINPTTCTVPGTSVGVQVADNDHPVLVKAMVQGEDITVGLQTIPAGGGSVKVVPGTPCWQVLVTEASFTGLGGDSVDYSVSW